MINYKNDEEKCEIQRLKLGERIKIYRDRKGFTQAELGKLIGVSSVTVLNYEKGRTVPDIETLANIIRFLDMPRDLKIESPVDEYLTLYCPEGGFEVDDDGNALCETKEIKSLLFTVYSCRKFEYSCLETNGKIYLLYNDVELEAGNVALVRFKGSKYFVIAEFDGTFYKDIFTGETTDKIDAIAARVLGEVEEYEKK